jgi:hypothetical protein
MNFNFQNPEKFVQKVGYNFYFCTSNLSIFLCRVLLMDLEFSPRCEKDRLIIEDGRSAGQNNPVTQVHKHRQFY